MSGGDSQPMATQSVAAKPTRSRKKSPMVRAPATAKELRILGEPGFVLHSFPYKETSLIVEMFSRQHGRVAVLAKGARRPYSQLRGALQTFQPLSLSWTGKSTLRTLVAADWVGGLLPLEKSALLCGFYLNELLVKLLAHDDPHPALFDHYVSSLNQLAHNEAAPIVLRKFELALLKETGVAAQLAICADTRMAVQSDVRYVVDPERGPRQIEQPTHGLPCVLGKTLLDMERGDYSDAVTQVQSKTLMRFLLSHHLGGVPLKTRQILMDLMLYK